MSGVESRDSIIPTFRLPATSVRVLGAWWAAVDSNHLPPRYQHGALPVELAAQRLQGETNPRPSESTGSLDSKNRP